MRNQFVSNPVVIEAIQWTGKNTPEVVKFCAATEHEARFVTKGQSASTGNQAWNYIRDGKNWSSDIEAAVYDEIHETWVGVKREQWIIRGMRGEFYPCDPDVFDVKYRQVLNPRHVLQVELTDWQLSQVIDITNSEHNRVLRQYNTGKLPDTRPSEVAVWLAELTGITENFKNARTARLAAKTNNNKE